MPLLSTARTVTRAALQLALIVSVASIQRFTVANAIDDHQRKALLAIAVFAVTAAILLPTAALLLLFGPAIVAAWTGGAVAPGLGLFVPLIVSMLLAGAWMPLSNFLVATNRQATFAHAYLALALAGVLAGTLAAPVWGVAAMAWALVAVDVAMVVVVLLAVRREALLDHGRIASLAREFGHAALAWKGKP